MPVPKKSCTGGQPPATVPPPSAPASPLSHPSPRLMAAKGHPGPGLSWFNLTRQDVERMSWEQLQKKAGKNHRQSAEARRRSLWQRLASLFRRSDKGD